MSETPYSKPHPLLVAFAPEYKQQQYHLHGRNIENWESFKSIFLDSHNQFNKFAYKVAKGAIVGAMYGILARNFAVRGPRSFELDRIWMVRKQGGNSFPLRGYTSFGGFIGAGWWLIKDVICLPHGEDSYLRHICAYGLLGSLLIATIVHPANIVYGFMAGSTFGGVLLSMYEYSYPKNFELRIKGADQERRRRLLREDEQSELSQRNFLKITPNHTPL